MGKEKYLWFLAIGCWLLAASCGGGKKDNAPKVKYETKVLKYESRVHKMLIPATLHGMNEVEIYPQVEGVIRQVNFLDGTKVKKGQTLFLIDDTQYRLKVQNARASLSAARAQMESTRLRYEWNQKLAAKHIISDYVLETSLNAYHVAQATVEEAQSQLAIAQTNLGYCNVKSPIAGITKENGFKVGALANVTDLLCTVSDDNKVQAWFSYTESQLLEAIDKYGLKLTSEGLKDSKGRAAGDKMPPVKLQLKNGTVYGHEGIVTEIGGIVDRNTGTVICKATFPNPDDELRSGLSATLIFPTTLSKVLCVPQTAAVRLQNRLQFYRVKQDGTVEGIICEAIPSNDGKEYFISSGLNEGDEVVTNGARKLSNGDKVR